MITYVVEKAVRLKRPGYTIHPSVSGRILLSMALTKFWAMLRGWTVRPAKTLFMGRGVRLLNRSNIRFGRWVQLDDFVFVSALGKMPVTLGNQVHIGAYSRMVVSTTPDNPGSHITIGDNVGIGEFAYLGGAGGLDIGNDCIIGQYFSCHPENHNYTDQEVPIRLQGVSRKGIRIGRNCWIGSKVTVLDGVVIGDNCVVAAGAVVHQSMPSNSVIAGVPARVVKSTRTEKTV